MITVVGSVNLDLIATVARLPIPGETVTDGTFVTAPGGKGANQALAAARAGAKVRMVAAVGKDAFAGEALSLLTDAGVDLSAVVSTDAPTGTAVIMVGHNGENVIAVAPGANRRLETSAVTGLTFGGGDVVLLQHEVPPETIRTVIEHARAGGARTVLNTAPWRTETAALAGSADIMVANEGEFDRAADTLQLAPGEREQRMREWAKRTGRPVIVTLGAEGVLVADGDGLTAVPALPIEPVDTVGAGDTFCGYLAASLQRGDTLTVAVRRAAVAASLACLGHGAQPAIPAAAEVDKYL